MSETSLTLWSDVTHILDIANFICDLFVCCNFITAEKFSLLYTHSFLLWALLQMKGLYMYSGSIHGKTHRGSSTMSFNSVLLVPSFRRCIQKKLHRKIAKVFFKNEFC